MPYGHHDRRGGCGANAVHRQRRDKNGMSCTMNATNPPCRVNIAMIMLSDYSIECAIEMPLQRNKMQEPTEMCSKN